MKFFITLIFVFTFSFTFSQNKDATCVCCTENHTAFDFWEGNWEVTKPDGSPAGKNVLKKIQDGCVLQENWSSASSGYTGTSYSFYNSKTNQWEQIWIDNQGGTLHLKGYKVDNQMILRTDIQTNKKGEPFYHRLTWTHSEDGSVRQYWETITNYKDIAVAFDGLYKKTK